MGFVGENKNNKEYVEEETDEFIKRYTRELFLNSTNVVEYKNETEMMNECQERNKKRFIHFYSDEFDKCRLLNDILDELIQKKDVPELLSVGFRKINVKKCMKTVESLGITILPYIGTFRDGYFLEGMHGFEKFGNKEDICVDDVLKYLEKSVLFQEEF